MATAAGRHILRTSRLRLPILVRNALLSAPETEPLSTHSPDLLRWYTCGPTVYDDAHIGHARAYVTFDLHRRLLSRHTAVPIHFALGLTDVDDKILARARERAVPPAELAAHYEQRFLDDMAALNVQPPSSLLRVSEHVPEIVAITERLVAAGAAYPAPSGSVYFSVASRGDRYTQLDPSRAAAPGAAAGADQHASADPEVAAHRAEKRDPRDFALWKAAAPDTDVNTAAAVWPSPWGPGRPGWHVECAAMAIAQLGPQLDIHAGGIDLRFPHHTNELAAAEADLQLPCGPSCPAPSNERWAHTWLHAGHLHQAGRKMSKSLKNFVTVREFLRDELSDNNNDATSSSSSSSSSSSTTSSSTTTNSTQWMGSHNRIPPADLFRLFCLSTRFEAPVEFTADRRNDARAVLASLAACARTPPPRAPPRAADDDRRAEAVVHAAADDLERALADNLSGPGVLKALRKAASAAAGAPPLSRAAAQRFVADTLATLGFSPAVTAQSAAAATAGAGQELQARMLQQSKSAASSAVEVAVQLRARARAAARAKNTGEVLSACDEARDKLGELGVRVADAKDGTSTWTQA